MPIVLASASPRRQELLKNAGIEFVVKPANISEVRQKNEAPQAFAERMAKEKARAVWAGAKDEYVLGADTIVVVDDLVLGKPEDEQDAARMLRLLSRRLAQRQNRQQRTALMMWRYAASAQFIQARMIPAATPS